MKTIAIFALLERGQGGLNRIIVLTRTAEALALTSAAAGALALLVRLAGGPRATLAAMAAVVAAGLIAGLIRGLLDRLDRVKAAGWLDRHLHLEEALSAALLCLARSCSGPADTAVIERAESLSGHPAMIRWPMRRLANRSGLAAGAILFAVAVGLWLPRWTTPPRRASLPPAAASAQGKKPPAGPGARPPFLTAREIAENLFPQDRALADQTEAALRQGNVSALERLIAQAEQEMVAEMARADSADERERLAAEQDRRLQAARSMMGDGPAGGGDPGSEERGPGGRGDGTADGESAGTTKPGGRQGAGGEGDGGNPQMDGTGRQPGGGNGYGEEGYMTRGPSGAADGGTGAGGNEPGTGRGSDTGDWGDIASRAGQAQAPITQNRDTGVFEYVMPGKEAGVPLSQVLPDRRRAAEGALARDRVPGEYEDFVRWYFWQLSQETSGIPPEEDQT